MEKITLYYTRTHEQTEVTQDEFLEKFNQLAKSWEPGWYVMYDGITHQILPGKMSSIPNSEAFKEMIRRGVW